MLLQCFLKEGLGVLNFNFDVLHAILVILVDELCQLVQCLRV